MTTNPYSPPASVTADESNSYRRRELGTKTGLLLLMVTAIYSAVVTCCVLVPIPVGAAAPGRIAIQAFSVLLIMAAVIGGWKYEWRTRTVILSAISVVPFVVFPIMNYVLFRAKLTRYTFFSDHYEFIMFAMIGVILGNLTAFTVSGFRDVSQRKSRKTRTRL